MQWREAITGLSATWENCTLEYSLSNLDRYFESSKIPKDHNRAYELIKSAADGGDVNAINYLGFMYVNSDLTLICDRYEKGFNSQPPNHNRAFYMYASAADKGLEKANIKLNAM